MQKLKELELITKGRKDFLSTEEFAKTLTRSTNTLRKNYCLTGHCYGVKPIKVGGRLLWPVSEIISLLGGEVNHG